MTDLGLRYIPWGIDAVTSFFIHDFGDASSICRHMNLFLLFSGLGMLSWILALFVFFFFVST